MGSSKDSGRTGSEISGAVPPAVVSRLSLYLRELQVLVGEGQETISSTQLGRRLGFTDAQVRKDLAYFGQFGYPGIGYRSGELVAQIQRILGTDDEWSIGLIGIGNLGRALIGYRGFQRPPFRIVVAFDVEPQKVGASFEGIPVFDVEELPQRVKEFGVRLGVLAVPAAAAKGVAEKLVDAGLKGIFNFAPVKLSLPDDVQVVSVDLAVELEQLTFAVVNRGPSA